MDCNLRDGDIAMPDTHWRAWVDKDGIGHVQDRNGVERFCGNFMQALLHHSFLLEELAEMCAAQKDPATQEQKPRIRLPDPLT